MLHYTKKTNLKLCNFELCNIFWEHLITQLKVLLYMNVSKRKEIPIHKLFQPIVSVTHHFHAFKVGNKRHKIQLPCGVQQSFHKTAKKAAKDERLPYIQN